MTDHTTLVFRRLRGSDGYAWWSVPDVVADSRIAFAPKADATPAGVGVGTGNIASASGPSASIAA